MAFCVWRQFIRRFLRLCSVSTQYENVRRTVQGARRCQRRSPSNEMAEVRLITWLNRLRPRVGISSLVSMHPVKQCLYKTQNLAIAGSVTSRM